MSKRVQLLQVLVSGPSDVANEKRVAREVINEANRILADEGIMLRAIGDAEAASGVGTDPQAVLNAQLDDSDLYVGIMWHRLGTATNRSESGTTEEFERALQRYRENPGLTQITFFASTARPELADIDPEQLAAVRRFATRVSEAGVYYREYGTLEEFRTELLPTLVQRSRECARNRAERGEADVTASSLGDAPGELDFLPGDEDEGQLDLLADYENSIGLATDSMTRIGTGLTELRAAMEERTGQANALRAEGGSISPTKFKRVVNQGADDLERFVRIVAAELPAFRDAWATAMEKVARYWALDMGETGVDEETRQRERQALQELDGILSGTERSSESFRQALEGLPRLTVQYKRALRSALWSVDEIREEVRRARQRIAQALGSS